MSGLIRKAAREISRGSCHVRIDDAALTVLAERLLPMPVPVWDHSIHFFDGGPRTVLYFLLLDALNFCFWPSGFIVHYNGSSYGHDDGYPALAVGLKRAFEADPSFGEPAKLAAMTADELRQVFSGTGEVPLSAERLKQASNVGQVLTQKFGGDVTGVLAAGRDGAAALAAAVARDFAAYQDARTWAGETVPILKRAQIFVSDLAGAFGSQGFGAISGLDDLTCFADYKLPQLFRSAGAFVYAPDLDRRIRELEIIPADSPAEVEIRGNTIEAIERLKVILTAHGRPLQSREIDWLLWHESLRPGAVTEPHHRTVTTSY